MASPSLKIIEPDESIGLSEYAQFANLRSAVHDLQTEAATLVPQIGERTVWMVSSTAEGGGVAEMLPKLISILCELGVKTKWVVIQPRDKKFFQLTKRLHNLVHGSGDARLERSDRDLYESISGELADDFDQHLGKDDVLVVHDPQPLGMGAALKSSASSNPRRPRPPGSFFGLLLRRPTAPRFRPATTSRRSWPVDHPSSPRPSTP